MSFELSKFKTDEQKEIEGVWENLTEDGEAAILVARVGNKAFNQAYKKLPKVTQRMIEQGLMLDEDSDKILCSIIGSTILLDWRGLTDEGKLIKYSTENAAKFLLKYKEFRSLVWELAQDFQRFHDEGLKADIKNSKCASDGN